MSPEHKRKKQEAQKNIVLGRTKIFVGVSLRAQRGALFDYEGGCSLTTKLFLPPCFVKPEPPRREKRALSHAGVIGGKAPLR
jgi:hypothetical protein